MNQGFVERLTFQSGDYIFKEGDSANNAYIIQSGSVEIVKSGEEEVVLATIPEGGIFGEMALIDDSPRMAAAASAMPPSVVTIQHAALCIHLDI